MTEQRDYSDLDEFEGEFWANREKREKLVTQASGSIQIAGMRQRNTHVPHDKKKFLQNLDSLSQGFNSLMSGVYRKESKDRSEKTG